MIWIIMPVYNTEKYLEEAIESILGQTIFYQDDIRLLLLDDASRDGSLAICKKYEKQYPDKIRVIHFENNRGVSRVRNYGLSLCAKEPIISGRIPPFASPLRKSIILKLRRAKIK